MCQKHVDLEYKDVSTYRSLIPMFFIDVSHIVFRGRHLHSGRCNDHVGPHKTLNLATGFH